MTRRAPGVEGSGPDDELRGVILREYGHGCGEPGAPRWRVEAICAEPPVEPDEDELLRRAVAAAGLAPQPLLSPAGRTGDARPDQAPVHCGSRPLWASACSKTEADAGTVTSSAKPSYCR